MGRLQILAALLDIEAGRRQEGPRALEPSFSSILYADIRPLRCHEAIRILIEDSLASTAAEVVLVSGLF
ncbi:MAG: hypothetical protein ABSA94_20740, partial [Acidobacteriaceae bacterium]